MTNREDTKRIVTKHDRDVDLRFFCSCSVFSEKLRKLSRFFAQMTDEVGLWLLHHIAPGSRKRRFQTAGCFVFSQMNVEGMRVRLVDSHEQGMALVKHHI